MKILAFGASYSSKSINKKFAEWAAHQFKSDSIEVLDLKQYDLPVFNVDLEAQAGHPEYARQFIEKLAQADLIIISLSEHNGSYSAAFKNLFDWASRIQRKMFDNKKVLLLSTSTGSLGGANVMEAAVSRFPRHGAQIIGSFSLPDFDQNFNDQEGITDELLLSKFKTIIAEVNAML